MNSRPDLSAIATGAELRRWYWLKDELVGFARHLGIPTGGGKQQLTARLAAHLDGAPFPETARPPVNTGAQLTGTLTPQSVIPSGQRCSQELRAFFQAAVGRQFRFDAAMRDFVANGAGRTLGDAVDHWRATRSAPPASEIGEQFELNRFLRAWHAAHPDGPRTAALAAWRQHRSLPVDARPPSGVS